MEVKIFIERIQSFASATPDKVMFVDENATRQTTYAEFLSLTQKIAALVNERLQGQERIFVPIFLPDSMEYFASEIAIWMTGNAAVHMGLSFPKERVDYIMEHCEAEFMIDAQFIGEARQSNNKYTDIRPRTADQPCAMFYTSGSTGNPKGVLHRDAGFMHSITRFDKGFSLKGYKKFASTASCYFIVLVITYSMMLEGAELHILTPEAKRNVQMLEDYIADQELEFVYISPSLLRVYRNKARSLKTVQAAGERLVDCYTKEYTIVNTYGQTETAGVSFFKVLDKNYDNTPIGKPLPGVEVVILNNEGQEVPDGEVGELCYTAGIVPPVYYKEPEQTAALTTGGVMHTGDLVKRLPNGDILYVQRKDWMVKINGQRVEPGEVETVIRNIPGVRDTIVKGFTTDDLTRQYLVGYYILEEGSAHDADSIKTELSKKVPPYMVPQYMVQMESFPLNANNKIDRKSLLPPDLSTMQSEYVAPTNEVEKALCEAFAKVLKLERVGIDDNFTLLGGDSIRLMQLQQSLTYDIPTNIVLSKGTPRKIAEFIAANSFNADEIASMSDYPLNSQQLFFLQQALAEPESTANYLPSLHRMPLGINAERLKKAVEDTVNAHPSLLLRIVTDEQGNYRMKRTTEPWRLNVEEMTEREFEVLRPNLVRCFHYLEEILFEARLIKTEQAVYLYHNMHHVVTDGVSNTLFIREISQAYSGAEIPVEEQTIFELTAEMEHIRQTTVYDECKAWFTQEFEGSCPGTNTVAEGEMMTYQRQLNIPSHQQMNLLCDKYGVTLNALFMAVVAKAVAKDDNRRDVRLSASFHGRMSQKCQRTIGFLATPRLYRFHWDEQESMADYLTRCKEHIMGNMARAVMPAGEIIQLLNLPMDDHMFIYQGQIGSDQLVLDGVVAETQQLPTDTPNTRPLCIFVFDKGDSDFLISIWYDSSRYTQEFAENLISNFEKIINKP